MSAILICCSSWGMKKATESVHQALYWADIMDLSAFVIIGPEAKFFAEMTPCAQALIFLAATGEQIPISWSNERLVAELEERATAMDIDETGIAELHDRLGRAPLDDDALIADTVRKNNMGGPRARSPTLTSSGYSKRPRLGSKTGRVWAIAEELERALTRSPTRPEVVARCDGEGINPGTASTQYGRWTRREK